MRKVMSVGVSMYWILRRNRESESGTGMSELHWCLLIYLGSSVVLLSCLSEEKIVRNEFAVFANCLLISVVFKCSIVLKVTVNSTYVRVLIIQEARGQLFSNLQVHFKFASVSRIYLYPNLLDHCTRSCRTLNF
jgi:hypothetical protein